MSLGICWDALGKPRAETAAWKGAEEKGLKPAKTGHHLFRSRIFWWKSNGHSFLS